MARYLGYVYVFHYEHLLRFPESSEWEALAWGSAAFRPSVAPLLPGRPGQDAFSVLLEVLLQRLDGDFSAERAWVNELGSFTLSTPSPAANLFGDGQDASVFVVTANNGVSGLEAMYAVHTVDGGSRVEQVMDWQSIRYEQFVIQDVRDTNGNGLPEVIVAANGNAAGMPAACWQELLLFERQSGAFVSLGDDLKIFRHQSNQGNCHGVWAFGVSAASGAPLLEVTEYRYTAQNCPDFEIRRAYIWDGAQYKLDGETIPAYSSVEPVCQLSWALAVVNDWPQGWRDDRAIDVLAGLLDDWHTSLDVAWGPASRDYFRLRLGLWRDLRGEGEQALALLQPLAETPLLLEYDGPSRIAAAYLAGRQSAGLVGACVQAQAAWETLYGPMREDNLPQSGAASEFIQHYGFIGDYWASWGLCSRADAFRFAPLSIPLEQSVELQAWFDRAGVLLMAATPVDLNYDGKQDWLVLMGGEYASDEIWSFVNTAAGWKAVQLASLIPHPLPAEIQAQPLFLAVQADPAYMIQSGAQWLIFQWTADGSARQLLSLHGAGSYEVQEAPQGNILAIQLEQEDGQVIPFIYRWDAAQERFVEQETYHFAFTQSEAERLLFQERDFAAAAAWIEQFLKEAPPEPRQILSCNQQSCEYLPDWYHPYLRYLLGIAYELGGFPEQATRVYYELWSDDPADIFGLVAGLKLEPISK